MFNYKGKSMNNFKIENLERVKSETIVNRTAMLNQISKSNEEKAFQCIHNWWLDNDIMDKNITDSINSMRDTLNMSGAIHALSLRFRLPKTLVDQLVDETGAKYYVEIAKMQLASSILRLSMERDYLLVDWKSTDITTVTGAVIKQNIPWLIFTPRDKSLVDENGLPKGLHTLPGELLSKAIKTHPWEPNRKYTSNEKSYLREKASSAIRLIVRDRQWWTDYFMATEWFNETDEDSLLLEERVTNLVDIIEKISKMDRLYLSWWLDARGRSYPELQLAGIKLHGDSTEKHIWELSSAWTVTRKSINRAKIACATIVGGKLNSKQALDYWKENEKAIRKELLFLRKFYGDTKGHKYGDVLYHESLLSIVDSKIGDESHKLIGEDLTTNGLAIFGSNFKLEKPMFYSNIGGAEFVQDAHGEQRTNFAKGIEGITRKDIKDNVSTPLFHGSGVKSMAKTLTSMGLPFSPKQVHTALTDTFGPEIMMINRIAQWGKNLYSNKITSLRMTSPDGNIYFAQAYVTKNVSHIQGLSFENKSFRTKTQVTCNMPILFSNDGKKVINNLQSKTKATNEGEVKISGYYAHITHMLDGFMLRQVSRYTDGPILDVHDNFFTEADVLDDVAEVIRKCHKLFYDNNYFEKTMQVTVYHHSRNDIVIPTIKLGDAKKSAITKSKNFLQQ